MSYYFHCFSKYVFPSDNSTVEKTYNGDVENYGNALLLYVLERILLKHLKENE